MKKLVIGLFLGLLPLGIVFAQEKNEKKENAFYQLIAKDINGKDFAFEQLKGKKVLIVNVASKCGLTPQYKELQALYKKYSGDGDDLNKKKFIIIGFPANDFGKQEPGTNEEIKSFCTQNYGVTFPMMAKITVKGDEIHPVYQWLTRKEINGVKDAPVEWNFQKFLIDEQGKFVEMIPPKEKPDSEKIAQWLEEK
ncbi:MAG: glutathione peroxidase [Planctomycetaceae bacterium]|nr:glutathione peroxidase [Planctomycetaceae bacterium]